MITRFLAEVALRLQAIRFRQCHGGGYMPRCARAILLTLALAQVSAALAFSPTTGDLGKLSTTCVRVMTYNNQKHFISDSTKDAQFKRIIEAINPDVIIFNEIDDSLGANSSAIATLIKTRLETYSPSATWTVWVGQSDGFNRNALCSKYSQSMQISDTNPTMPSTTRGCTAARISLSSLGWSTDLYIMGVHLKSGGTTGVGGDADKRQQGADALTNWMRDARTSGGNINLPSGTPMLVVGDTNLGYNDQGDESPYHASETLLDGNIYNTGTYGSSSAPDWDGSSNSDAVPYDYNNAEVRTQPSTGVQSRFDRFYYTDSVMRPQSKFVLNTETMTTAALAAAGLSSTDTSTASDHLPTVVDFVPGADTSAAADVIINEFSFNDSGADDKSFVELKNVGGREINLDAPDDYWLKLSTNNIPNSVPASENENSAKDLKGVIPAGGVFVVYGSTGESSAIKTTIETNLTDSKQRQDTGSFSIFNGPDAALALVTQQRTDLSVTSDTLVEAYAYASSSLSGTYYFRTASTTNLIIPLSPVQRTTSTQASDNTLSRKVNDTTHNSFANWVILDTATPGLQNSTLPVELSKILIE